MSKIDSNQSAPKLASHDSIGAPVSRRNTKHAPALAAPPKEVPIKHNTQAQIFSEASGKIPVASKRAEASSQTTVKAEPAQSKNPFSEISGQLLPGDEVTVSTNGKNRSVIVDKVVNREGGRAHFKDASNHEYLLNNKNKLAVRLGLKGGVQPSEAAGSSRSHQSTRVLPSGNDAPGETSSAENMKMNTKGAILTKVTAAKEAINNPRGYPEEMCAIVGHETAKGRASFISRIDSNEQSTKLIVEIADRRAETHFNASDAYIAQLSHFLEKAPEDIDRLDALVFDVVGNPETRDVIQQIRSEYGDESNPAASLTIRFDGEDEASERVLDKLMKDSPLGKSAGYFAQDISVITEKEWKISGVVLDTTSLTFLIQTEADLEEFDQQQGYMSQLAEQCTIA
ncbi:hypothetical protein [Epibacterium ulvae]|uniref:hypothetical protein n=1 Tax=Epibacterium ulvae TaxID=1156985 RepID=UPI00248F83EE|nr:hypothetical protein [Epibacterium ulvae]